MNTKRSDYMFYYGFQSPGEKTSFQNGILYLGGKGADLGCGIMVNKDDQDYTQVSLMIRGNYQKSEHWTRLRIEVYGSESEESPAVVRELVDRNEWKNFTKVDISLEGKISGVFKIQMMIIGPSESNLEFKDIVFS